MAMEGSEQPASAPVGEKDAAAFARTERRIAWLTLALGAAASILVAALRHRLWAEGLAIGAVLHG
jgi:hypothetical protein